LGTTQRGFTVLDVETHQSYHVSTARFNDGVFLSREELSEFQLSREHDEDFWQYTSPHDGNFVPDDVAEQKSDEVEDSSGLEDTGNNKASPTIWNESESSSGHEASNDDILDDELQSDVEMDESSETSTLEDDSISQIIKRPRRAAAPTNLNEDVIQANQSDSSRRPFWISPDGWEKLRESDQNAAFLSESVEMKFVEAFAVPEWNQSIIQELDSLGKLNT